MFGDGGVDTLPDVADALLCHSRTYPCTVPIRAGARKPMMIDDGLLRGILWLGSGRVARRLIILLCTERPNYPRYLIEQTLLYVAEER